MEIGTKAYAIKTEDHCFIHGEEIQFLKMETCCGGVYHEFMSVRRGITQILEEHEFEVIV